MMNPRDVEHIALLARIALTEGERDRMGRELSAILEYVKTLDALGLENEVPLSHVHEDFAPPRPRHASMPRAACRARSCWRRRARDDTSFLVPPVVDTR
jgi:aspartyl/glutamyl-tRNA(Asn/Gln) amidotransferase C subunit